MFENELQCPTCDHSCVDGMSTGAKVRRIRGHFAALKRRSSTGLTRRYFPALNRSTAQESASPKAERRFDTQGSAE